jgi:hypothetical protein
MPGNTWKAGLDAATSCIQTCFPYKIRSMRSIEKEGLEQLRHWAIKAICYTRTKRDLVAIPAIEASLEQRLSNETGALS